MSSETFTVNPVMAVDIRSCAGKAVALDFQCFSRARGYRWERLTSAEGALLAAAVRLVEDGMPSAGVLDGVSRPDIMRLWYSGFLLARSELDEHTAGHDAPEVRRVNLDGGMEPAEAVGNRLATRLVPGLAPLMHGAAVLSPSPEDLDAGRASYLRDGCALIDGLLPADVCAAVGTYLRLLAERGWLQRGDRQSDRFLAHSDPVGRRLQHLLHRPIERVVGQPIKPSYTYAALYCGGSDLPRHVDRPQCEYTVSLLIDHRPETGAERSGWPLCVQPPGRATIALHQAIGGGALFRGHRDTHHRTRLPDDESCCAIMLHYVDEGFTGTLT